MSEYSNSPDSTMAILLDDVRSVATIIEEKLYFTCIDSKPIPSTSVHYFSVDDELEYENFYSDFGPLNLAMLYKFCCKLQRKLKSFASSKKKIIYYSSSNGQKRANAAYLIGSFSVIYLQKTVEHVWLTLEKLQPPKFMPFRDASLGYSTYGLLLRDVFAGIEKAVQIKWLDFEHFDCQEYEFYEKVENGDFNWIIPNKILAFCGPHNKAVIENGYPYHSPESYFDYFSTHNVSTIVRLNKKMYDSKRFVDNSFVHIDLFFVDGSCPKDEIVVKFIEAVDQCPGALAIHCKAGLGRTGTLIACWMMKEYKWTAAECISWIRICRPGSIIGPQQQFVISKQAWCWEMPSSSSNIDYVQQNTDVPVVTSGIESRVNDIRLNDQRLSNERSIKKNDNEQLTLVKPKHRLRVQDNAVVDVNANCEELLTSEGFSQGDRLMQIKTKKQHKQPIKSSSSSTMLTSKQNARIARLQRATVSSSNTPPVKVVRTIGPYNSNSDFQPQTSTDASPTVSTVATTDIITNRCRSNSQPSQPNNSCFATSSKRISTNKNSNQPSLTRSGVSFKGCSSSTSKIRISNNNLTTYHRVRPVVPTKVTTITTTGQSSSCKTNLVAQSNQRCTM